MTDREDEIRAAKDAAIKLARELRAVRQMSYDIRTAVGARLDDALAAVTALQSPLPTRLDLATWITDSGFQDIRPSDVERAGAYWLRWMADRWRYGEGLSPKDCDRWADELDAR